ELEHRVLPVEGDAPKTALAGWFRPAESLHNLIRHANETQSSGDDGGELPSVPPSRSAASS
ncbi:MAG: hypothetical protein WBE97_14925, partial [Candidatus Acidiferrales bacterium]